MQASWPVVAAVSVLGAAALVCALFLLPGRGRKAVRRAAENHGEGYAAMPGATLVISHAQNIGKRSQQQDAYNLAIETGRVAVAVCDGMGGMEMGAEAARLAVDTAMPVLCDRGLDAQEAMIRAMNQANERVYELCRGNGGATAVFAVIDHDGLRYITAGDSRLYVIRDGLLRQMGQDHIFYYDLLKHVRGGSIPLAEANAHPEREHLTSFLGKEMLSRVNASDQPVKLKAGDVLLICTDGVYRALSEQEITATLAFGGAADIISAIELRDNQKQDNSTAVVIKVRENG